MRPEGSIELAGWRRLGDRLSPRTMTPLPGAPFLHRRGTELWLEDVRLADLAATHGTPLYVYSRAAMRAALAPYQMALSGRRHLICYAMKANSSLAVLQTFAASGCGFDIVSGGELQRVLAIGGDPSRVVFSGVGKTDDELLFALAVGVRCFNVESESELLALSRLATAAGKRAPISLRVNPDIDAKTHPYISTGLRGNKFGIAHERAAAVYRHAANLPGIEVVGIDCHIGSQVTDSAPYLAALERLLDLVETVEREGVQLSHIDLGGGLGITYTNEAPPAADELIGAMLARIDARGHGHREILIEPGRSLVGNAGILLARVLVLKRGSERNFCIVDAAMNDLVRPAMYDAWMGITACTLHDRQPELWDVVGPICESGDWLGRERSLAISEGDLLAVTSAGAYAMAMASNYNSRPRAAEVMIEGATVHVIRRRETLESLYADERPIG
jgi:diaminopimelate decarboxylase